MQGCSKYPFQRGAARRGYEDAYEMIHFRGGLRVLVKRTAVYEVEVNGDKTLLGATQP